MEVNDRIARLTNQMNQPATCEKCGGTWFAELTFNQYSGGIYSSAPGGDLRIISTMPQAIRICLCGHPVAPNIGGVRGGQHPNTEMGSFFKSMKDADEYRSQFSNLDSKLSTLVKNLALQSDLDELKKDVETMKKFLEAIAKPAEEPAQEKPAEKADEPKRKAK